MYVFAVNNRGALFRILGDVGVNEFIQISEDNLASEYDVSIEEAPITQEEKQEQASLLVTMADKLLALGDPSAKAIYAVALKYMPLDKEDVSRITQILIPQDEVDPAYVQQLEQQLQALMSEMNQAEVKKKMSEFAVNIAKVDQIKADTQAKAATTVKTLEEAEQKDLENKYIKANPQAEASISI